MPRKKIIPKRRGTVMNIKEYAKADKSKIGSTYMKYYRLACQDIRKAYDVTQSQLEMMLFVYDLEYFTAYYICKTFGFSRPQTMRKDYIDPLVRQGLLFVYMKHGDISNEDRQRFNIEESQRFRTRYCLSQKGRYMVHKLYSKMQGKAPIFIDD